MKGKRERERMSFGVIIYLLCFKRKFGFGPFKGNFCNFLIWIFLKSIFL